MIARVTFGILWYTIRCFRVSNGVTLKTLIYIQRVLALCYFWDLEKTALAKNRISKIFILCTH